MALTPFVRLAPLALAVVALGACKPEPAPVAVTPEPPPMVEAPTSTAPVETTYVFQCEDLTVSATYGEGDAPANLVIGDRTLSLNHAESASGARYADDAGNEFWIKGTSEGMLTLAGEKQRNCTIAADAATPAIDPASPLETTPPSTDSPEPTEAGEPSTPPAG